MSDAALHHTPPSYRGRFAPSPTGPLHFGSLVTAVASFLQARCAGGFWHVRIDDLDPPREVRGASDDILRTLEAFGFTWDDAIVYQSRRTVAYEAALEQLRRGDHIYPCACTRREIADSGLSGVDGPIYPGTCRNGIAAGRRARSWRLRTDTNPIRFHDRWQGEMLSCLAVDVGDFVVRRADGQFAYHLAMVVDDHELGITEVVRGADLLDSTARQIFLQKLLGVPPPAFAHVPAAVNLHGEKLSKQTYARPLDIRRAGALLTQALAYLGQEPPLALSGATPETVWAWALQSWRPERVAQRRTQAAED